VFGGTPTPRAERHALPEIAATVSLQPAAHHRQRRQPDCGGEGLVVQRLRLRDHAAQVPLVAPAVDLRVGIQRLPPAAPCGRPMRYPACTCGVRFRITATRRPPSGVWRIKERTLCSASAQSARKARRIVIALEKGRLALIQLIEVAHQLPQAAMIRPCSSSASQHSRWRSIPRSGPVPTHHQQFLARKKPLIRQHRAQVGELLPSSPGIFPASEPCRGPLHRGEGQNEVLRVLIQRGEGQVVLVIFR